MQHSNAENVELTPQAGRSLATNALDYELPASRIATRPVEPRDAARMLVVRRTDPRHIEHRQVRDLPEYLRAQDVVVLNNTAVAPARLVMRRATGGRVEGLFLRDTGDGKNIVWNLLLRSGGRLAVGDRLTLLDPADRPTELSLEILQDLRIGWLALLRSHTPLTSADALASVGRAPLPPYILKARVNVGELVAEDADLSWYQTVYADLARRQSVAAPTAGLHFTSDLLERIDAQGARRVAVTLHVGHGTFKPVTAATLREHRMHAEWFEVPPATLVALDMSRRAGGQVLAIGTTTARALESLPVGMGDEAPQSQNYVGCRGMTDLLIAPPYEFRNVDGMLTNFHLPRSTLLAMVAAMIGLQRLKELYREAIDRGYRFYSYGDAMLILP